VRDEEDFFSDIKSPKVSKDMVELASHILETKAAHFDPKKFEDEYENALKALVKRKASGKTIKAPEKTEKADNVIDLMAALKQSLMGRAASTGRKSQATPSRAVKKSSRSSARARKAS
jgi:DNA end-binding protein Ku